MELSRLQRVNWASASPSALDCPLGQECGRRGSLDCAMQVPTRFWETRDTDHPAGLGSAIVGQVARSGRVNGDCAQRREESRARRRSGARLAQRDDRRRRAERALRRSRRRDEVEERPRPGRDVSGPSASRLSLARATPASPSSTTTIGNRRIPSLALLHTRVRTPDYRRQVPMVVAYKYLFVFVLVRIHCFRSPRASLTPHTSCRDQSFQPLSGARDKTTCRPTLPTWIP
ncbi:hypothetical protein P171DRAFT_119933 [Karstenula rhodostoma CBS 690.94]|uniref:Uncharacterized protein n=1 Tax=Karstenula rhodostoma CBS 690.94 TaxID=1392251 RepID=A0A9P4U7I8_9PLEO|nr:hypothetical protein P171DRAFT_119933 [Karstenula rhodostoma CBS 690.94]